MENSLLVFISSVIGGMAAERGAVQAAIRAIPLTRPWLFELTSASALPLAESYLSKVRACDIFVLLLGQAVTDPVKEEARTAKAANKPRLVFVDVAAPPDVIRYAQSLGVKYATYRDADELAARVAEAVGDELIRRYREHSVPRADLPAIIDLLEQVTAGTAHIGGSFFGGEVDNRGGFLVGGNYTVNVAPEAPPLDLLRAYYTSLAAECCRLPLGVIDVEYVRTSGVQPIPLPDIYVDLDVVTAAEERPGSSDKPEKSARAERTWALRLMRGEGSDRAPLLEALAAPAAARTVLLGDPGSGKTTFVNYLAYLLCGGSPALPEGWRGLLPVRLVLRDVAARYIPAEVTAGTAQMLWAALHGDIAARLGADAADKLLPYLRDRLLGEGGFILLDGLDEVPEARRRRAVLLAAVRELADVLGKTPSRILVTARPYAYADRQWRLPRFATLALAPFNEAQIGRFVDRWYDAVRPFMGWGSDLARDKGRRLQAALNERAYLADLASRPLLLTLMATLHSSWGQLPEDRAGLYEETVKLLLGRWQRLSETKSPDGEPVMEPGITQALGAGEERIRAALEALAFAAHDQQRRGPERDDGPADVSEGDVLVAFKPLLGSLDPDDLLRYLKNRTGLLVARREGIYAFPHRSFQEYLAACHLARTEAEFAARLRDLVSEDAAWWREVFLLGVGKKRQGGLGDAVNVINTLLPQEPERVARITDAHWRAAALAGQAALELKLPVEACTQPHCQAIVDRTRRWLERLVEEGRLPAAERAAAGDILAQLGDPRFDPDFYALPCRYRGQSEPLHGFVEIPAGPFVMGSRKGDKDAYSDELGNPPQVQIPYRYWIARYPTTVAQMAAFVAAGGYAEDAPWWTAAGRAWLKTRSPERRGEPMGWDEQQLHPNRPVMGVSWFEAVAYCRWLNAIIVPAVMLSGPVAQGASRRTSSEASPGAGNLLPAGYEVRLPTEAEWERAARGQDGRVYAWGNEPWDEERANIENRIGHASPAGMYPRGATAQDAAGLHDLTGNVWEWTLGLFQDYPYRDDDGRNAPEAAGRRVVRGGSWDDHQRNARCACRNDHEPDYFNTYIGFRVVLSLSF